MLLVISIVDVLSLRALDLSLLTTTLLCFCLFIISTIPPLTVNLTAGGAVAAMSPPSCAFTRGAASRQTAADTETVWTDAVGVRTAGRAPPATLWCVSRQPAVLTVSALPVSVEVELSYNRWWGTRTQVFIHLCGLVVYLHCLMCCYVSPL